MVHVRDGRETPNDPKLRDRGGWRECCAAGLLGAALVTAVAVLCSAWLDVAGDSRKAFVTGLAIVMAALLLASLEWLVGHWRRHPWVEWEWRLLAVLAVLAILVEVAAGAFVGRLWLGSLVEWVNEKPSTRAPTLTQERQQPK